MDVPALVVVVLLVGLALVAGEIVRAYINGRLLAPPWHRRPLRLNLWVLGMTLFLWAAVPLLTAIAWGLKDADLLERLEAQTFANLVTLALVLTLLSRSGTNRLADYGIEARGCRDEVRYGGIGFLVSIPLVLAMLIVMSPIRGPESQHPFLKLLGGTHSDRTIVEVTVAAVVVAPLTEELVFRVVLQGMLQTFCPPAVAILVPAAAFAAVHGTSDAIPLFPLAVILGVVYYYRRSYVAVVTLHALFNAANLCIGLAFR